MSEKVSPRKVPTITKSKSKQAVQAFEYLQDGEMSQPATPSPNPRVSSVKHRSNSKAASARMRRKKKRDEKARQDQINKVVDAWGSRATTTKSSSMRKKKKSGGLGARGFGGAGGSIPRSTTWNCSLDSYGGAEGSTYAKEVERARRRNQSLETAIKRFNVSPKKAIRYALDHHVLPGLDPKKSIAKWLYEGKGLSKKAIGEYLGSGDEFAVAVLNEFTNLMNFPGETFDNALRRYLQKFCLPGEAQMIDRIVQTFAYRWFDTNPNQLPTRDVAYTLAFSLMMLNTDAHNPNVEVKMTGEQFVDNIREVVTEEEVSSEYLLGIYNSIVNNEIKFPEDHDFSTEKREGMLSVFLGGFTPWRKRWVSLKDHALHLYGNEGDENPRAIIFLDDIIIRQVAFKKQPFSIECTHPRGLKLKMMDLEKKIPQEKQKEKFIFSAETKEDQLQWVADIRGHVRWSSFMIEEVDPRLLGKTYTSFESLKGFSLDDTETTEPDGTRTPSEADVSSEELRTEEPETGKEEESSSATRKNSKAKFVRITSGDISLGLKLAASKTIEEILLDVAVQLAKQRNEPCNQTLSGMRLFFRDEELPLDKTLKECDIPEGSELIFKGEDEEVPFEVQFPNENNSLLLRAEKTSTETVASSSSSSTSEKPSKNKKKESKHK